MVRGLVGIHGLRVLVIGPDAPGLPGLDWRSELSQLSEVPEVVLDLCVGRSAVRAGVAGRLHESWDVVLWSGHGAPGRLLLTDGAIGADWLACMMRQAPPGVVVLSACFSGARDTALQSMAETLSHSGITTVGMWVEVADRAAIVYDVEFIRALAAGASVAVAHRVAVQQVALDVPQAAGAAFLLPGLMNGYGLIREELAELRLRVEGIEAKLDKVLSGRPVP
jgi:hypothetical protein